MPLGPEQGPERVEYTINFTHPDLGPEGSTIYFAVTHDQPVDTTEAESDTMFQKLVDLIDGSPDFNFQSAQKTYTMNRPMTATA
jgi:hypothetical protein